MQSKKPATTRVAIVPILAALSVLRLAADPPNEPVIIGQTPQYFIDDHIVDSRWALNYTNGSTEMVVRVFHAPKKHPANPLIVPHKTFGQTDPTQPRTGAGFLSAVRDPSDGVFRIWYQLNIPQPARNANDDKARRTGTYAIAYAESKDGLSWKIPDVDPAGDPQAGDRNVIWRGTTGNLAEGPCILDLPEHAKRGFKHVMLYIDRKGLCLIGSQDGIRWDPSSVTLLAKIHSDTQNCLIYDEARRLFVMYCRPRDRYGGASMLELGEGRRIAVMTSPELWREWKLDTQIIMVPDELDARQGLAGHYIFGVKQHAGVNWGFLTLFKWNTDLQSEMAFSRGGLDFWRFPHRPKLIELGNKDAWDDGMIISAPGWVEVGDEWWLYYTGYDGPHGYDENRAQGLFRTGSIGLATLRKDGFVSMRGPENGGVIVTRRLRWPGGRLMINVNASGGELRVRVTDDHRKVVPGLGYDDCVPIRGDSVGHEVKWTKRSLDELKGESLRLEFQLARADLYSFRATDESAMGVRR